MELVSHVLAHYPAPMHGPMTPLGNHGGFSGAELFRVDAPGGALCLRAWPAGIHVVHLDQVHSWMMVAALRGLDFVPRIMTTERNSTVVAAAGRFWDLTTWMPGAAAPPSPQRVQNASIALARLHLAWAEPVPRREVCPAVLRRLAAYNDWLPVIQSGWQPVIDPLDPIAPSVERAWVALRRLLPKLPGCLLRWRAKPLPLQPCLCDIWSDHVLFVGDRVTGLVDYGSCKIDHVAVDLARLLGSMAGTDPVLWIAGLNAYAQLRPLTEDEQALARDLDQTGAIVAVANWLRWLVRERRTYEDLAAVTRRLAALIGRLA